jgi:uncharacterized protein
MVARLANELRTWSRGLAELYRAPQRTPRPSAGAAVLSFNQESFDAACAELMRRVLRDGPLDLIVGIPTGGRYVAETMARAVDGAIPVRTLTCRRASTRYKTGTGLIRRLVAGLPQPILDRLRLIEHRILTHRPARVPSVHYRFDRGELAAFNDWVARAGKRPAVLVVDDAVDSGATLFQVLNAVRRCAPAAQIRSAVITVTSDTPLVYPEYALYHRKLCRFPWSLDAATERPS